MRHLEGCEHRGIVTSYEAATCMCVLVEDSLSSAKAIMKEPKFLKKDKFRKMKGSEAPASASVPEQDTATSATTVWQREKYVDGRSIVQAPRWKARGIAGGHAARATPAQAEYDRLISSELMMPDIAATARSVAGQSGIQRIRQLDLGAAYLQMLGAGIPTPEDSDASEGTGDSGSEDDSE